jgi:hypothetical protein
MLKVWGQVIQTYERLAIMKIKKWLMKVGVVICGVVLTVTFGFMNQAKGESWYEMPKLPNGDVYFFDKDSVSYQSKNIVNFRQKVMATDRARREAFIRNLKEYGKPNIDYNKYSHTIMLIEMNCKNQTFSSLSSIDYAKDDNVLRSSNDDKIYNIRPKSASWYFFKSLCLGR